MNAMTINERNVDLFVVAVAVFPLFVNTIRHWASGVFFLIVLLSIACLFRKDKPPYVASSEEKFLIAILLFHVIAVTIANTLSGWTKPSIYWFEAPMRIGLSVLFFICLMRKNNYEKFIPGSILLSSMVLGITAIVDSSMKYNGFMNQDADLSLMAPDILSAEGVYGRIFLGNIMVVLVALNFAVIRLENLNNHWRKFAYAGFVIGTIGVIVSFSRNAWVSLPVVLIMVYTLGNVFTLGTVGRRNIFRMCLITLAMIVAIASIPNVKERAASIFTETYDYVLAESGDVITENASNIRFEQWKAALILYPENPIFGGGIGNMGWSLVELTENGQIRDFIFYAKYDGQPIHIHNAYIQYLVDTGVVGLVSILLILGYPFYLLRKYRGTSKHVIYLSVLSMCFILASLTEVPFIRNNWTSIFLYFYVLFAALTFKDIRQSLENKRAGNS